jgi:DNA-binding NarL/FixJ family response regulator
MTNAHETAIRIVIADDHPIVQRGLTDVITACTHFVLTATVSSFRELLECLPDATPDVVVLDLNGMGSAPLPLIERLRREYPNIAVVVFSSLVDCVPEMLKAGAHGYVIKEEREYHLVTAIEVVYRGKQFLSPIAEEYVARSLEPGGRRELTVQQVTAVKYIAQGLSTEAIAAQMGIDPRTVLNYITLAKRKTGSNSRLDLVDWYRRTYLG